MFPRPIQQSLVSLGIALAAFAASSSPAGARVIDPPASVDAHHAALVQRSHQHHTAPLAGTASPASRATRELPPDPASEPAPPSSSSGIDALPLALGIAGALMLASAGAATVRMRQRRSVGTPF